jgi:hypothetical protein
MEELFKELKILTPSKILGGQATSKSEGIATTDQGCKDWHSRTWHDDKEGADWELTQDCMEWDCPD